MFKKLSIGLLVIFLSACTLSPYVINKNYQAESFNERVRYVIMHYTNETEENSLKILTGDSVSSHYLIGSVTKKGKMPVIYQLVPEDKRAWHAGKSAWQGRTNLNDTSIGIEISNMGCDDKDVKLSTCDPYSPEQIQAVIILLRDLQQRYGVLPENVLGHSDIAPFRKIDPGPQFPWQKLAEKNLVIWPKKELVTAFLQGKTADEPVEDIALMQRLLKEYGYDEIPQTGVLDDETRKIISAFQMHFRNRDVSGNADAETLAILQALLQQRDNNP